MLDVWNKNFSKLSSIFIICGPSGVGKTTLIKKLLKKFPNIFFSISYTTRKIRKGEKNGIDYNFIDKDLFENKIKNKEFIEYAKVHGHYYGTPKEQVFNKIEKGKRIIIEIDIQGMKKIKKFCKTNKLMDQNSLFIFIAPPSRKSLKKQLLKRGTDNSNNVKDRLLTAEKELSCWKEFDYLIVNEKLEKSFKVLKKIIQTDELKVSKIKIPSSS